MYWLGTAITTNYLLEQCFSFALANTMPESLLMNVSDGAFVAAATFVHRRFLAGQAVLAVTAEDGLSRRLCHVNTAMAPQEASVV